MTQTIDTMKRENVALCRTLHPREIRRAAIASACTATHLAVQNGMPLTVAFFKGLACANDLLREVTKAHGHELKPVQPKALMLLFFRMFPQYAA